MFNEIDFKIIIDTIYKKLELGVQNIQAADSDMDTFFLADN